MNSTSFDQFTGRTVAAGASPGKSANGETWTINNASAIKIGVGTVGTNANAGFAYYDNSGTGSGYAEAILGTVNRTNIEVTCRFNAQTQAGTHFGLLAKYANGNYYRVNTTLNNGRNASLIQLELNNGGIAPLRAGIRLTTAANTYYWLRLRINTTIDNKSILSAKIWQDGAPAAGSLAIQEPLNWTLVRENSTLSAAGGCGIMLQPTGNTVDRGLLFDNYAVLDLTPMGKFDYFLDGPTSISGFANWNTQSAPDGTGLVGGQRGNLYAVNGVPVTAMYSNGYLLPNGGAGGFSGRCEIVGDSSTAGSRHIFYLQHARNFLLAGTWAWKININGPTTGDGTFEKVVKAVYLIGGSIGNGNEYYEADFEFGLEPFHPFFYDYPFTPLPALLNSTYNGTNDTPNINHPSPPTYVGNSLNNWITCVLSVTQIPAINNQVIIKTEHLMAHAQSGGQYQYLGSNTLFYGTDPAGLYTNAYIDMHYVEPTGGNQPNSNAHQMQVAWFYYSPTPNDYPSVTA